MQFIFLTQYSWHVRVTYFDNVSICVTRMILYSEHVWFATISPLVNSYVKTLMSLV